MTHNPVKTPEHDVARAPCRGEDDHVLERHFLETLLENSTVCIAVMAGPDLRYMLVNAAYQKLRPDFPMPGRAYREVFPAAVASGSEALMREVLETGVPHEDYGFDMPIPGKPDAAWDRRITRLPAPERAVLVMTWDVTARKRAERAVRESERRLATLVSHLPGMAYRCRNDPRWTVEFVSAGVAGVTGYAHAEFASNQRSWADIIHPDDETRVWAEVQDAIAERRPFELEYRIVHRDGSPRWVWERGEAIYDAAGEVIALEGFATDITERKLAEAELRLADRRKDEFLAMLAHELRNPLVPIANAVAILDLQPELPAVASRARAMIAPQVCHMVRLIDDLIDVGRITRGRLALRRERLALSAVIRHSVETVQPSRSHAFSVSLPAEEVWVDADPVRLAQAFSNLLDNACKCTAPGGRIWLSVATDGREVAVSIRDEGRGLAPEDLPHLFEMFWQGGTRMGTERGIGLGLALTRALVELHGGTIAVASAGPGAGAEFSVRLACLPADAVAMPAAVSARAPDLPAPCRVLVVDDTPAVANSLADLLEALGSEPEVAASGEAAMERAKALRPDLILLDIGLPGMTGYEVCRRIRRKPWGKYTTIIALTGWGSDEDKVRSFEAGFDAHLVKPVQG
ncbi:MAG TPA: ATP-binding protein, partial [Pelomicrobium sp.]|nr:ATP-binding protein [Pelomicrobium sp.]